MAHPKMARAALKKDAALLVYPGGAKDLFRPYAWRNRIHLANNKAFIKLALIESAPIVPLVSHGAHETLIVLADLYPQLKQLQERKRLKLTAKSGLTLLAVESDYSIAGASVVENLQQSRTIHSQILPTIHDMTLSVKPDNLDKIGSLDVKRQLH